MKLATLRDDSADGRLVVVSRDLRTATHAEGIVANLRLALQSWDSVAPQREAIYEQLNRGGVDDEIGR